MFRNYFLLNLILLALIGLLSFKSYKIWTRPLNIPSTPEVSGQQKIPLEKVTAAATEEKESDEGTFQAIVQKDLFRPLRTEPKLEEISKPGVPLVPPKLFGTVIMGDEKTAILEDPSTKITKSYRINDSVAGFIVSDIQKDKVVFLREGETIEVYLREIKTFRPSGPMPPATLPPTPAPPQRPRRIQTPPQSAPPPPPEPVTPPDILPEE